MNRNAPIERIVIHSTGTRNGLWIDVECIDHWHAARGFRRDPEAVARHESRLRHLGYHWVIYTSGSLRPGRHPSEPPAPVTLPGQGELALCLVGADAFTPEQWSSLALLVRELRADHPGAQVLGHRAGAMRGLCHGDGSSRPCAQLASCPGFSVADWLAGDLAPLAGHVCPGSAP